MVKIYSRKAKSAKLTPAKYCGGKSVTARAERNAVKH